MQKFLVGSVVCFAIAFGLGITNDTLSLTVRITSSRDGKPIMTAAMRWFANFFQTFGDRF